MTQAWTLRLGRQAEQDYGQILRWTVRTFGVEQSHIYAKTISLAMQALADGPDIAGSNLREDIAQGIRILHVARMGRKGRHFIVFRAGPGRTIDVLRLLHDSMDLPRHLGARDDLPH